MVFVLQRLQLWLPLNPQAFVNVSPDSSFNTAVSFATNTNWQGYAGESTMSYFTQMLALAVQNFFSAATGIAVAFALIRGFARRSAQGIGNFWVDVTRSTVYILLPLATIVSGHFHGPGRHPELRCLQRREYRGEPHLREPETRCGWHAAEGRARQSRDRAGHHPNAIRGDGPGGLSTGSHQNARYQWRRILQCKCGSSVREPHAAQQFLPDDRDVLDSRGVVFRGAFGRMGGRFAPGMGRARRHDADFRRHGRDRNVGRTARAIPRLQHWEWTQTHSVPFRRAATWKARKRASASWPPRFSPPLRPQLLAGAINAVHDSPSRPSGAWCRCG